MGDTFATGFDRDLVFTYHRLTWAAGATGGIVFAPHQLAKSLVAEPRFRRVLVADHPTSAPVRWARSVRGRGSAVPFPTTDRAVHVSPSRLRRRDPDDPAAIRRTYRRYADALHRAARRRGFDRPALLTVHPFLAAYGDLSWTSGVVFYGTDDYAVGNRWSPVYAEAYAEIGRRGLAVAAVSAAIIERIGTTGRTLLVPNGIDPAEWVDPGPAPAWFSDLPGPRLLYVGGLAKRLDVDAVAAVAQAFPRASVALVGHLIAAEHIAPLRTIPNVHVLPPVDRKTIAAVIAAADVGLIPHVVDTMTRAMSPLKGYEYLAAGLPVVGTPLPALEGLGPRVLTAPRRGFPTAVGRALELGRAPEAARRAFAESHAWERRYDDLLRFAAES